MKKDKGILHIPMSQFAFPGTDGKFTIRLRSGRDSYKKVTISYGDRAGAESPMPTTDIVMEKVATTAEYDWYETTFTSPYERVCYYFTLDDGSASGYYYADRFSDVKADYCIGSRMIDGRSEYYQYPYIMRKEIPTVPEWFRNAKVYNIFPDSFASGKKEIIRKEPHSDDGMRCFNNLGGTLKGIEENLDYIKSLGCDTVYLNPIFRAVSYHKYDIIDYYHVDPAMGTDEDLKSLVKKAHSMGMHIILDGVFNHTGVDFFAFKDIRKKGKYSKYRDWYYDVELPLKMQDGNPSYACFAYVSEMPKLDTSNPKVQQYFSDLGAYYVKEIGIDGWRLDVANEVAKEFLRSFSKAVKNANSEAVLIGEVWENAAGFLSPDLLDSVMDYDFRRVMREYFAFDNISAEEFSDQITELRMRYPEPYFRSQLNFLDSHDVARFLSLTGGNIDRQKQAIAFQMIFPGVPSVFYGDEKLIDGVEEPEYRKRMDWESEGISDFYRDALKLHSYTTIHNGTWKTIKAKDKTLEFRIGNEITAIFNNSDKAISVSEEYEECLLSSKYQEGKLEPEGFAILQG